MGDHPEVLLGDADLGERVPAALAVDDDPVEAGEQPAPERRFVRGAARQEVVRRKNRGQMRAEEERVELGRGEPLHVEDVRLETAERGEAERMLHDLDRQAQPRAAETRDETG